MEFVEIYLFFIEILKVFDIEYQRVTWDLPNLRRDWSNNHTLGEIWSTLWMSTNSGLKIRQGIGQGLYNNMFYQKKKFSEPSTGSWYVM